MLSGCHRRPINVQVEQCMYARTTRKMHAHDNDARKWQSSAHTTRTTTINFLSQRLYDRVCVAREHHGLVLCARCLFWQELEDEEGEEKEEISAKCSQIGEERERRREMEGMVEGMNRRKLKMTACLRAFVRAISPSRCVRPTVRCVRQTNNLPREHNSLAWQCKH